MRIVTLLVIIISFIIPSAIFAGWQDALEAQFDIVETFDNLPDWHGVEAYAPSGETDWVSDPDDFPDQSGGSGRINYYSFWGASPSTEDWIKDHGPTNVWRDTGKSMCLNENGEVTGASRIGFYIGTLGAGTPETTGYQDFHMFFMLKLPKNMFPTSITPASPTPIGEYTDGDTLVSTFMKLFAANLGCDNMGACAGGGYTTNYAEFMFYPHLCTLSTGNYEYNIHIQNHTALMEGGGGTLAKAFTHRYANNMHDDVFAGKWVGIEARIRNVLINDNTDWETHIDMWFYQEDGTPTQVVYDLVWANVLSQPTTLRWNNIMFGGNNSNNFTWGTGMEADMFIDDIIVDDARIGPTYFTLLGSGGVAVRASGTANWR